MRDLTVALAKGRLAQKAMEMFGAVGIHCEEMANKDSRKLIFENPELGMRFFLAKATDVPTYVEYGAADIGIVGKDTLLEEGRRLYEVLDLKIGQCRMCVCGPESARAHLKNHELIRVATKYPRIAKDYLYVYLLDGGNHQTERFHRAGPHCRPFRGHRGYSGDRLHPSGERPDGFRGDLPPVRPYGGESGKYEDRESENYRPNPGFPGTGAKEGGDKRMRIVQLNEDSLKDLLAGLLKRDPNNYIEYTSQVQEIVDGVKERGDEALFAYTEKFDGAKVSADNIRVTEEEIERPWPRCRKSFSR